MTRRWQRWGLAVGLVVGPGLTWAEGADEPKPATPTQANPAASKPAVVPDPALAERFAEIRREYDAQRAACRAAQKAAATDLERRNAYTRLAPDDAVFSRRMVDLAVTKPTDPASRDALVWVIDKPYRGDAGAYGDEFARAAALLVRHHADDREAVAVAFGLDNAPSTRRDAFLFGLVAAAESRETKGMARLALARYLEKRTLMARVASKHRERGTQTFINVIGDDGKPYDKTVRESDEHYADRLTMSFVDPNALHAEVERLYHEVIADYGDVAYWTTRDRKLGALLLDPTATEDGQPLSEVDRRTVEAMVQRRRTLGQVAERYLDELAHVAPGKPAPAIEGTDLDGKPLKLADYQGKVVVLVFWGSWCGPCLAEVPHERAIAAKYRDRPLALLGVNARDTREAAQKAVEAHEITWPNWLDGNDGPIVARYHVESFPTVCVIDASGLIRSTNARGEALDHLIDKLLAETDPARAPAPAPTGAK